MKQVNLDCEGPITKNDNALEISGYFLPEGEGFFSILSKYDDFMADIVKRTGYRAGTTLAFILPFLKAYGATNNTIRNYSRNHLSLVPGAKKTVSYLKEKMSAFIISTSYQPYVAALCDFIDFPQENTYSTALDLDKYKILREEVKRLKTLLQKIMTLPSLNLSGVKKKEDLSLKMQETVQQLDDIFQKEIPSMECGRILEEVTPLGGKEKAKAVLDSLEKTGGKPSDVMYVGDSITDVEALKLAREGGLAISFNGNAYALKASEIACLSPHTFPLEILAEVFCQEGKEGVFDLVEKWPNTLENKTKEKILSFEPPPQLEIIEKSNLVDLTKKSERLRKGLRGDIVGKLG